MLKLTKRDRQNIEVLCKIADRIDTGQPVPHGKTSIRFNQDQAVLLHHGFEYGFTRESMFGYDNEGNLWQVSTVPSRPAYKHGQFTETVWYQVDDRGLRHKRQGGITLKQFYQMFKRKT